MNLDLSIDGSPAGWMFLLGTICVAWCVFSAFFLLLTSKLFGRQPLNSAFFRMFWFTGRVAPIAAAALYSLGAALRHQVKHSCLLGLMALALAFFILPFALLVLRPDLKSGQLPKTAFYQD